MRIPLTLAFLLAATAACSQALPESASAGAGQVAASSAAGGRADCEPIESREANAQRRPERALSSRSTTGTR
jgi:hypothetical protein